ncbi:glucose-1-phosphate thymidylyltransferase [Brevibacillus fulvus]|uniref:Glucose-1-phosphate thymidylyltransferase n=1 Tax=Brevibacillus fulvus TaxID=1125967 RepID=A0A939BNB5_9BACL|nr:glucose-1-phosphate thymidylyltransferase [Brevibacillus fulvus]MBM7588765.1 glucose-1-phosphate thymidylyltransferase [Brevibacillus fulvus]
MKGLILCAGRGTRLHPFSFSQPKTLLPVANHPVLYYCIRKLLEIGINEIGIVIHPSQTQIHEFVQDAAFSAASITFIEQPTPLGIANAVLLAKPFIGDDPFLLLLGDNLLMDSLHQLHQTFLTSKADGVVMLSEVERPQDYGIAEVKRGRIVSVEEKPRHPKSNLAIIGAYLFTPLILEAIEQLQPSARGEYEITDAIQALIHRGCKITHTIALGKYSDVGTIDRWLQANRWMLKQELDDQIVIGEQSIVENCELIGPVLIGNNCRIANCKLGPYLSVQDGVELLNCHHIEESILLENSALINIDWTVTESVFGRFSRVVGNRLANRGVFTISDKSYIMLPSGSKGSEA